MAPGTIPHPRPARAGASLASHARPRVVSLSAYRHLRPDILRTRAVALGVPYLHLPPRLPEDCRGALPASLARELRAAPVGRTGTALTVAFDAPWDRRLLLRLRAATGLLIFPVLTAPEELERALRELA